MGSTRAMWHVHGCEAADRGRGCRRVWELAGRLAGSWLVDILAQYQCKRVQCLSGGITHALPPYPGSL